MRLMDEVEEDRMREGDEIDYELREREREDRREERVGRSEVGYFPVGRGSRGMRWSVCLGPDQARACVGESGSGLRLVDSRQCQEKKEKKMALRKCSLKP
ncbi:hypothetical protein CROQUDRAFT_664926 [Cronartium quercuum f. sp. fusiforme G11]|uniref:Uncharacterized protein n=1 Tax=Cronartium quercuum f. sp. fusiforme G11 TaxID=708437 RepID=A0A9P6N7D2_9BASI|nr:hypothetical protein CROQUDRAFT_664926 [Cronartium quercuum f. sp. fusiforme G11]